MKPAQMIINCGHWPGQPGPQQEQSHKSDINCDTINETHSGGDTSCHERSGHPAQSHTLRHTPLSGVKRIIVLAISVHIRVVFTNHTSGLW